jgi:hypothetical protein
LYYEKLEILLRIPLDMRGTAEGLSLDDIRTSYRISRRTAERLRDAIERVFPQMEQANPGEVPLAYSRWRPRRQSATPQDRNRSGAAKDHHYCWSGGYSLAADVRDVP